MSQEIINVGSAPNDGSGDPIRTAFIKCNNNFTELYDIPGKSLANGTSSITIDYSANVNVNVSNIADLAVFTSSGLMVQNSITTANLFATNIVNPVYTNDLSVTGQIFVDWLDANANPLPGAGIVASVANIYDIGEASSYFGNIYVGNVLTNQISSSGNIYAGNISVLGNITGNILFENQVSVSGNILSGGLISAAGNVIGSNIVTAGVVTATGNVIGSNIVTAGVVTATGNIYTAGYFVGRFSGSITGNVTASGSNTDIQYNDSGNLAGSSGFTFDQTNNSVSIGGNINVNSTGSYIRGYNGLFTNNVTVAGTLTSTSNIVANISGTFYGDAVSGNSALFGGIPGFTPLGSNVVTQFAGNANSYSQINFQNINTGSGASTDFILTAANGNDSTYYADWGITSNNHVDTAFFGDTSTKNDVYLYAVANNQAGPSTTTGPGNLILGSTNGQIKLFVGNTAQANVIQQISSAGISVTGNVNATNIISATGNIVGNNLVTPGLITATGNITGGNINTAGYVTATGNISTAGYFNGIFVGSISGNITAPGSNTQIVYNNSGNLSGSTGFTFNQSTNAVSISGNTTSGNFLTAGLVSATGNIIGGNLLTAGISSVAGNTTSGNFLTAGVVSATGNITGGNLLTAGISSVAGNITGGNINTVGLISATSNITGGNINTTGVVSATGNIIGGNIRTPGFATVTGNITGGNLLTAGLISATGNITGNFILGNGSQLTGIVSASSFYANGLIGNTLSSNVTSSSLTTVGNLGNLTVVGNTTSGNLLSAGQISLAGNVTANNFFFNGSGNVLGNLNVQGNITFINSNVIVTNDLYFELANNQSTYANINGAGIQAGNTGTVSLANWTYNYAANAWVSNLAISALGNVAGANITTIGLISSTGNVVSGNIITSGLITATGNISTAGYFVGAFSGSISGNVTAPGSNTQIVYNNSGNLSGSTGFTFNQSTNAMTLSGNATSANFLTAGLVSATGNVIGNYIIGNGSQLTSLTGANITGQVANALIAGTVTTNAQPNITSVGTLTSITSSGLISTTGNVVGNYHIGNGSQLTSLTGANVTGNVANALIAGTVYTNAQPNITSVGTLTSITSSGLISTTGNVVGNYIIGNGSQLTGLPASYGNTQVAAYLPTYSGNLTAGNISVTGNVTGNYFVGTATHALYADLAECYRADDDYAPGTVVSFGGDEELTVSRLDSDTTVAGVISTDPAYLMNSNLKSTYVAKLALTGRTPCQVQGSVTKGAMMISAGNGRARAESNPKLGSVIGKALESFNGDFGTIEIVVGRL